MKKIQSLGRSLTKQEQKQVKGGYVPAIHCECYGSVGAWTYTTPPTGNETLHDIATYCRSGYGSCTDGASIMPA